VTALVVFLVLAIAACSGTTTETVVVTFDSDSCTYTGPVEFDLDTELTANVTNEVGTSFGFAVWKVPDGTTTEDIEEQGMLAVGGSLSQNERGALSPGSVSDRTLVVVLNETGTWAFNCFVLGSSGADYPTIVEVR
jgi:hypothetical protein